MTKRRNRVITSDELDKLINSISEMWEVVFEGEWRRKNMLIRRKSQPSLSDNQDDNSDKDNKIETPH